MACDRGTAGGLGLVRGDASHPGREPPWKPSYVRRSRVAVVPRRSAVGQGGPRSEQRAPRPDPHQPGRRPEARLRTHEGHRDNSPGVTLGPGTLYGAITRLEERGLIEPEAVGSDERRRPYRITGAGRVALEGAVRDMRRLADEGALRLGIGADGSGHRAALGESRIRYERLLRWYPREWRDRYGGEMTALLEDTYATAGDVPVRARLGLVRRGLAERARTAGFIGSALEPAQELRAGAVLVLCGWPLFLIAGAVFGKFADNWWIGTPAVDRLPASASFNAVAVLGVLGCTVVGLAALLAVPSFVRLVRAGRWEHACAGPSGVPASPSCLRPSSWAVGWPGPTTSAAHDRNGGLAVYSAAFVVIGLAAFVAILLAAAAAVAVARRIDLPDARPARAGSDGPRPLRS